jgi:hypothetical protein
MIAVSNVGKSISPTYWVDYLVRRIEETDYKTTNRDIIISDFRFIEEREVLEKWAVDAGYKVVCILVVHENEIKNIKQYVKEVSSRLGGGLHVIKHNLSGVGDMVRKLENLLLNLGKDI